MKQGIKKSGEKGITDAHKEIRQLHDRVVFELISINEMTMLERKRAMESLILLNEKRDETINTIMCANGSNQREYILRKEATNPTALLEAFITTGVIYAKQKRDVIMLDIPNEFLQTEITLDRDKIITKIRGQLVNIHIEIFPGV